MNLNYNPWKIKFSSSSSSSLSLSLLNERERERKERERALRPLTSRKGGGASAFERFTGSKLRILSAVRTSTKIY